LVVEYRIKIQKDQEEAKKIEFDISKKKQADEQSQRIMKALGNSNFLNASKIGYLFKRSRSFFRSWEEKFAVVTNVGLLYYDDPNKQPQELFPIIDSKITKVPKEKYNRNHVFSIMSFNLEIEFAAQNEDEYDSWIKAFQELQNEFDKRKNSQLANIQ